MVRSSSKMRWVKAVTLRTKILFINWTLLCKKNSGEIRILRQNLCAKNVEKSLLVETPWRSIWPFMTVVEAVTNAIGQGVEKHFFISTLWRGTRSTYTMTARWIFLSVIGQAVQKHFLKGAMFANTGWSTLESGAINVLKKDASKLLAGVLSLVNIWRLTPQKSPSSAWCQTVESNSARSLALTGTSWCTVERNHTNVWSWVARKHSNI